ncbi:MAG: DUF488 domain-containing protein [Alphaproteobacteria bacterium]|nr:DUF488 domain-containing protein [Alphaproteobacteria bacterium]
MIKVKRIYDGAEAADGYRVLVDRLWPRGITKDAAKLDNWMKEIAPSPKLRTWYSHEIEKWPEFVRRYEAELASEDQADRLKHLADIGRKGSLTLLFAARDEAHNSARVLLQVLEKRHGLRK